MSGIISEKTMKKYQRHQEIVEALDKKFVPYKLRFLISLADHKQVLMIETLTQGKYIGMRQARQILKWLEEGQINSVKVYNRLIDYGQKFLTGEKMKFKNGIYGMTDVERRKIRDDQDRLIRRYKRKGLTDLDIVIETPLKAITIENLESSIYPQFYSLIKELLKNKDMTRWVII